MESIDVALPCIVVQLLCIALIFWRWMMGCERVDYYSDEEFKQAQEMEAYQAQMEQQRYWYEQEQAEKEQ